MTPNPPAPVHPSAMKAAEDAAGKSAGWRTYGFLIALAAAVSPWIILLGTGRSGSLPLLPVVGKLIAQILVPILLGQSAQAVAPAWADRWRPRLGKASLWLLLILVWVVMCTGFARGFDAALGLPLLIYHPLQLVAASLLVPGLKRWNAAAPQYGTG